MKNKILTGFSLLTLVVVVVLNLAIAINDSNGNLSIDFLGFINQAQAENGTTTTQCNGSACEGANGMFYKTDTKDNGVRICCGVTTETDRGCKTSN